MSTTVKVYLKNDFAGILNKNNAFSKQTASQAKGIAIGLDKNNGNAIGRGYLDFDLSKIPSNAKIEKVSLQLTSKTNYDANFGGAIRIERASIFSDANATTWSFLKTQSTVQGYTGLNHTFAQGYGYNIIHQWLTDMVSDTKGKSLQLMIDNRVESSSIVWLDGSNTGIFLSVTYGEGTSTGGGGTGGAGGSFPGGYVPPFTTTTKYHLKLTKVLCNPIRNNIRINYESEKNRFSSISWIYSKDNCELVSENHQSGFGEGLFRIKKTGTRVETIGLVGEISRLRQYAQVDIPLPVALRVSEEKVFVGETVEYIFDNYPEKGTVKWEALQNLELLSYTNTRASFRVLPPPLFGDKYAIAIYTIDGISIERSVATINSGICIEYPKQVDSKKPFTVKVLGLQQPFADGVISFNSAPKLGDDVNIKILEIDQKNQRITLQALKAPICYGAVTVYSPSSQKKLDFPLQCQVTV